MVEGIYALLESVGYTHPLHPPLTHAPMGMIIGMLVFGLLALKWTDKHFSLVAYYCSIVGFITVFPTIIAGILDWIHRYYGQWEPLIIIKMVLSGVLAALLLISIIMWKKGASPQKMAIIYILCMACAGGIGHSGGELVYG